MKWLPVLPVATSALGLVSIALAVLTIRAVNDTRRWRTDASNAVMSYSLAERALQLDLLNARVGLLRNYDPINADIAAANASLSVLDNLPSHERTRTILSSLLAESERQEALVERFKSLNALLQNSLTRFTADGRNRTDMHKMLSAPILRLTLDTSPQTVRDARKALQRMPALPDEIESRQLVAHARLLVAVLPEIDGLLQSIRAMRAESRIDQLQSALQDEANGRSAMVRRLELSLGAAILLFFASAIALIIVHRLRTRELKAQTANAQLCAAIAMPLIDTAHEAFVSRVQEAVCRLAMHIRARRLLLMIPGAADSAQFSWPEANSDCDWLLRFTAAADADGAWIRDRVVISLNRDTDRTHLGRAMREAGIRELVLLRMDEPCPVVIGFEPEGPAASLRRDYLAGLSFAMVAIAHGARRQVLQLEREQLERTVARAGRMETIGAMASGVAHNFNNIIGAIGGYAEMGQAHTKSRSVARRNFDEIQEAVGRARELVNDILDFARRGRSAKQPTNLFDVLSQTMRLLSASSRGETRFRLVTSDRRYPVLGAAGALQQVFLNICSNAAHASDGGEVEISAQRVRIAHPRQLSHNSLYPGKYIVVSVSDNGPGIAEPVRARLFEPFFSTKAGGTGLGLSTAWEIVQDHCGAIDVQSPPQGGSRFSVWLPEMPVGADVPIIGNGAWVLLLSEPEQLAADEERLAELGYEPLAFPLSASGETLRAALVDADAVLIVTSRPDAVADMVSLIGSALGERPLIVAAPDAGVARWSGPYRKLSYPFRPEELAGLLSDLRLLPATA